MILQALTDYYARKPDLPREGYELKDIPFIIEIEPDGRSVQILDTRESIGKKLRARSFLVPQGTKKSVKSSAQQLWGNALIPESRKDKHVSDKIAVI